MATEAPSITCPRCQKKFKGKPELIGKRIRCPGCEQPFVVPSPDAKIDEAELKDILNIKEDFEMTSDGDKKEAIQTAAAKRFFAEEDEGPKEYGVTNLDETHRCPNCANPMASADAVVCLFCGYNTSTRTWGQVKKVRELTSHDRFMWLLPGFIYLFIILMQIIFCLFYTLVLPQMIGTAPQGYSEEEALKLLKSNSRTFYVRYALGPGWGWMVHESLKLWIVIFNLFAMWSLGFLAYWRLVIHPTPPEKEIDD